MFMDVDHFSDSHFYTENSCQSKLIAVFLTRSLQFANPTKRLWNWNTEFSAEYFYIENEKQ